MRNLPVRLAPYLALPLLAATLVLGPPIAHGAKLVLRIRAANPKNTPQSSQVRTELPARVSTNDIISLGGLDLGYDVKKDVYYVHKEIELGPKEIVTFDVEIEDVWTVPGETIEELRTHARELVAKLEAEEGSETAAALRDEVEKQLAYVEEVQKKGSIAAGVTPTRHIRDYETSLKALDRIRKDIGRMENLVMSADLDPGKLVAPGSDTPRPRRDVKLQSGDYRVAVINISMLNTSPAKTLTVPVKRDLPAELTAPDVLDAGGLNVGVDTKTGICFVYKDDVEIGPGQTITFTIKIKDKWNINKPRIGALKKEADRLLHLLGQEQKYESIERDLQGMIKELDAIGQEEGPQTLNEAYVAFYRQQAAKLDVIDQKISRIESALRPADASTRLGFPVKPPSMKTTWMIIYIVLGFLAVLSLLFFLRWFGRSKAERLEDTGPAT